MSIGDVAREARIRLDMNQTEVGKRLNISRASVSHAETGRQPYAEDLIPRAVALYRSGKYTLKAAELVTGGASVPYLDGSHVDHHPASMINLAKKEIDEFEEIMERLELRKPHTALNEEEIALFRKSNLEALEAISVIQTTVVDNCDRFGFDYPSLVKEHKTTLVARKLLKRESMNV